MASHNLPLFKNVTGKSTCLLRKCSAQFLPSKSKELEQLAPRLQIVSRSQEEGQKEEGQKEEGQKYLLKMVM